MTKLGLGRLGWVLLEGMVLVGVALPGAAQEKADHVPRLLERDRPATTVDEWIAQIEAATVRVTEVRLDRTAQGLQVVLVTESGQALQATQDAEGKTLILTVPNAVLALSSGQAFEAEKPEERIDRVSVTQVDATTVQVSITGVNELPTAEVVAGQGLVLAVTPEAVTPEEDDEVEITVTAEQEEEAGYRVPNSSTATRTDTPIRDIPQSIQVVPQQVLEDRKVRTLTESVETVSGVVDGITFESAISSSRIIRGFSQSFTDGGSTFFRNGSRDLDIRGLSPIGTIEQVEVLKGPASVLFGAVEPGRIINTITKQPLSDPYYKLEFEAGNYGYYQPTIDLSGPKAMLLTPFKDCWIGCSFRWSSRIPNLPNRQVWLTSQQLYLIAWRQIFVNQISSHALSCYVLP